MAGVLDGIAVIDISQGWAGPLTSMYLADQGAEVIKVEPPGGDIGRGWYPSPVLKGTSRSFLAVNRNKQSMAVDLTKEAGNKIVHDLIKSADVLITNFRPRVVERLGLEYDKLSRLYPQLIYANLSGYGERGPYADNPAYDPIIQGLSGAMSRRLPDGTPVRAGVWVADCTAPMILAYGISLALLARERTGRGQKVTSSLLHSAIALQTVDLVYLERDPEIPESGVMSSGVYRCGDDKYVNVAALNEKQVIGLCKTLGLDHILQHESFLSEDRDLNLLQRTWRNEMSEAFLREPASEWLLLLMEADVPCGPVHSRNEVFEEAQVLENKAIVPMDHPVAGHIKIAGIPVELSDNPGSVSAPAPALGQHTGQILGRLGYSANEIEQLRAQRVVV